MSAAPSTPGYDDGGLLPARTPLSPATSALVRNLSPEQIAAYERALELVERWRKRDNETTHG